jgi:hypothetical protein
MEPDNIDDPGTEAADRHDNRTAIIVAVVAALVVVAASVILIATAGHRAPDAPRPTHSSVQTTSPTIRAD